MGSDRLRPIHSSGDRAGSHIRAVGMHSVLLLVATLLRLSAIALATTKFSIVLARKAQTIS